MTRTAASTLVNLSHIQMIPSQQHLTGKRKPDDSNPLLHAAVAKRAKKEAAKSAKRKLNYEEVPNGIRIVRGEDTHPSNSQPTQTTTAEVNAPRFASQPLASSSQPPLKRLKADSRLQDPRRDKPAGSNDDVEMDVRAMDDEADRLRRLSRAHSTINQKLLPQSNANLGARLETPATIRKGKNKVLDISTPMPDHDTPKIERNKQLRSDAMTAYDQSRGRTEEAGSSSGHRRKSSIGRGKRMSSSFEATGIITHPHNSVSESSFYKHIDVDLPEPERIRQLLIWCSVRASSSPTSSSSSKETSSKSLPTLSEQAKQSLKAVQDDIVRKLAEKRIDLNISNASKRTPPEELRENEQNVRNRMWEVTYSNQIQQCEAEEEAWKKLSYDYEAYGKNLQTTLDRRKEELQTDPSTLSAKAKGKRRATGDLIDPESDPESSFLPQLHELPSEFHPTLSLIKSVLGLQERGDDRIAGGGLSGGGRRGFTRTGVSREELQERINQHLPSAEYKLDQINTWLHAMRSTTNVAERMLNARFDVISKNLAGRVDPLVSPASTASGGGKEAPVNPTTQLLSTYVSPHPSSSSLYPSQPHSQGSSLFAGPSPHDLLRALSRVDQERPPAQVGEAARRAVKEVQRAGESGFVGAVGGEKRLTSVPATPRKTITPGTPRRGNTPARGATPKRDR